LVCVHEAAEWVRAKTPTDRRARQADDEHIARERLLISRLGQSFDREVDRCCWRLDSVPTETLQWLGSEPERRAVWSQRQGGIDGSSGYPNPLTLIRLLTLLIVQIIDMIYR
jgi:hypothetical protein